MKVPRYAVLSVVTSLLVSCRAIAPSPQATAPTSPTAAQAKPQIVATTSVLCDFVTQIAQDTVNLNCLVKAGQDPHTYEPTPSDRKALEDAALVLYGGYDFEPSVIKLVKATTTPNPKVAVHEVAVPQPLMGDHDHEKADPAHETEKAAKSGSTELQNADVHAEYPDPHVWHNAQNGIRMVAVVQSQLEKILPAEKERYTRNAQALSDRLTQLDVWIKTQIATIPATRRKLITTHDALGYYADAYKIPVEGALQGITTEEKPNAARIRDLVEAIKATQVPTVFAEVTANPELITTVAKEAQVKLSEKPLYADGLGESGSGAETYEQMLIANTTTIVQGLGGTPTPFQPSMKSP